MTLLEAKRIARKLFPRTISLAFVRVGTECVIRYRGGDELGRGGSWLDAMRGAALRFTECESLDQLQAKADAQEDAKRPPRALGMQCVPFASLEPQVREAILADIAGRTVTKIDARTRTVTCEGTPTADGAQIALDPSTLAAAADDTPTEGEQ